MIILHVLQPSNNWTPAYLAGARAAVPWAEHRHVRSTIEVQRELRECSGRGPVVVLSHGGLLYPAAIRGLLQQFPAVQFVHVRHCPMVNLITNSGEQQHLRQAAQIPGCWFATSEAIFRLEQLGIPRAITLPNPLAPADVEEPARFLKPPVVLFASRFDNTKGTVAAVAAMRILQRSRAIRPVFSFPPQGSYSSDSGSYGSGSGYGYRSAGRPAEPAVRALADAMGLQGVEFRPWATEPARWLASLRNDTSVCLSPSQQETFGYAAFEALGQGIPVIGSAALRYLPPCWTCRTNDPAAIAAAAADVLDDYPAGSRLALDLSRDFAERQNRAFARQIRSIYDRPVAPAPALAENEASRRGVVAPAAALTTSTL